MPMSSSFRLRWNSKGKAMDDAAPALLRRHQVAATRCRDEGEEESCFPGVHPLSLGTTPNLKREQASSVDDDDNQGIHRHDDTPHMVQLGYNLLYRTTAAAVVFGIDYNLLSGSLVHYTDCMPPLSSLPRLPHHRHRPSAFSFDAVVDS
ncbi:hypothetical protein CFC21_090154 [Triticum aestivum]|uniref:Uncharacterized protein n=2 Tax=Triticum aestivum TaxID=4565 RepID=A0A9R1IME6_WHEAT|nr:uncharacterized protein LOC123139822 isoform X3 [Triticum aestivum]XP_044415458.1 uncharacterized protein LOC123139822 isoform X3 [Triticum aestivum]KAF7086907.1 hypothetical protein CFC21_090154 [Triticum aestivum]